MAAFLYSCELDPFSFQVGDDLMVTSTKATVIDTLSVQLTTYKKDSIVTSNSGTMLAGVFRDELFGDIIVRSYFQIGVSETKDVYENAYQDLDASEICDSVSLILQYNQYYAGDTLQEQVYHIYELTEELEEDEDGGIYNFTGFDHSAEPLGSIRFYPRPGENEDLEIPLKKELGEDILEYLQDNSSKLSDDDFIELFKGFIIEASVSESNSVLGFGASDTTLFLKLYTHEPGPLNPKSEHLLSMTNSSLQYNQITYDLSSVSAFDSISDKQGIPARSAEDLAYIYGGLGLYTKVTFPYLEDLTGEAELKNSILVNVRLYLDPAELDKDKSEILENIRIYETESNGDPGDIMLSENGAELTADCYLDEIFTDNSYFMFDITDYLNFEIADFYLDPEFGFYLDLSSSEAYSTLDQLMLDGSQTANNNMRLELTFFYYDQ
jgi:hypothetical protein